MLIRIDLSRVPTETQYDFWQGVTPSAYRVARVVNGHGLDVVASLWPLDGMVAIRFAASAHRIDRNEKAARQSRARVVKVRLYRAGSGQLDDGSRIHRLTAGAVHVIDHSRPWSAHYDRHDQCSIIIPHERIGYDPSAHPVVRTFGLDTVEGRLLGAAMGDFFKRLEGGAEQTANIAALVEAALHGVARTARDPHVKDARDSAMRFFAGQAAETTGIDAETLGRIFGVSRATIYRSFAPHGGLGRFTRNERLDRASEVLAGRDAPRGEIGRLASRFGFSSTAHFSDAFLHRFGVRPSEAAGLVRPDASTDRGSVNDPHDLEDTMRHARAVYAGITG